MPERPTTAEPFSPTLHDLSDALAQDVFGSGDPIVVAIKGGWGEGKTYFWKKSVVVQHGAKKPEGGETSLDNLSLLCTYHHRALHEGGFSVEREADGTLHFERADGRTIPRGGYRLNDFTDDVAENPSNGMDSSPPANRHRVPDWRCVVTSRGVRRNPRWRLSASVWTWQRTYFKCTA